MDTIVTGKSILSVYEVIGSQVILSHLFSMYDVTWILKLDPLYIHQQIVLYSKTQIRGLCSIKDVRYFTEIARLSTLCATLVDNYTNGILGGKAHPIGKTIR